MARTGLYQSEVKKARDALIAQGKRPSVDAVRVALGNTGSKTTIHKYLKELEEQDGGGRKASVSDALQDLVARVAAQLHEEADARIAVVEAQILEKDRAQAAALAALRKDIEALASQHAAAEAETRDEKTAHTKTRVALQNETIGRRTAEQQVTDLRERLLENDAHRLSIEEKHKHAREALEHYRQSVKEQRDQDQRRHEHQVQQLQAEMRQLQQSLAVKQDDITRLNQEGARLVADLSHAKKELYDQQAYGRKVEQELAAVQDVANQARALTTEVASMELQLQQLREQLKAAAIESGALAKQVRDLELALAAADAKFLAQQEIVDEVRAYLNARELPVQSSRK